MPRIKTLLTPEAQWARTVEYAAFLQRHHPPLQRVERPWDDTLFVFRGTHPLVLDGDVFLLQSFDGMAERYGATGISSKGARLRRFRLPARRGSGYVELPDDFIGMQWNDPAIGRYVADLRASRRSRVSAHSPATSHSKTSSGIDTSEITSFGVYRSGRLSTSTRMNAHRNYLRFYPDGSVVQADQEWRLSFDPNERSPKKTNPFRGIVQTAGESVKFELYDSFGSWVSGYEGGFEHGRLWLSRSTLDGWRPHGRLPYRFHPFDPAAFHDFVA